MLTTNKKATAKATASIQIREVKSILWRLRQCSESNIQKVVFSRNFRMTFNAAELIRKREAVCEKIRILFEAAPRNTLTWFSKSTISKWITRKPRKLLMKVRFFSLSHRLSLHLSNSPRSFSLSSVAKVHLYNLRVSWISLNDDVKPSTKNIDVTAKALIHRFTKVNH